MFRVADMRRHRLLDTATSWNQSHYTIFARAFDVESVVFHYVHVRDERCESASVWFTDQHLSAPLTSAMLIPTSPLPTRRRFLSAILPHLTLLFTAQGYSTIIPNVGGPCLPTCDTSTSMSARDNTVCMPADEGSGRGLAWGSRLCVALELFG